MKLNHFILISIILISYESKNNYPFISKITNKIYLGSHLGSKDKLELKKLKISHILVCGINLKAYFPNNFKYKLLNVYDSSSEDIIKFMYESLNFIKSSSNNVFVHCFSGKGRSASFVIAYLMYKERKNFNEIYKYVKQKRTIISPNQFFIEQLKTLDIYFQKSKYNLKGLKGMNYTLIENWVNEH